MDALLAAFLLAGLVSTAFAANLWIAERALAISLSGVALFWVASALRRAGLVRPLVVSLAVAVVVGAATSLAQAYGASVRILQSQSRARRDIRQSQLRGASVGDRHADRDRHGAHGAAEHRQHSRRHRLGPRLGDARAVAQPGGVARGDRPGDPGRRPRAAHVESLVRAAHALVVRVWLGAAFLAGAVAAMVIPNRLEWKSDSPYLDSAAGLVNYKEGSGAGRLVQYGNSLRMTGAHPLFGVGPGNWPVVYPAYASRNDPSMSTDETITSNPWPSSDWVAYLSERGGIGLVLLLLAMLGLMGRALRELRRGGPRDPERVLTAIALVGTLVAVAVVGAFDAVLLIAAPTFFVWTLAGALAPPASGSFNFEKGVRPLVPGVVIALALIVIGRSAGQIASIAVFSTSTQARRDRASGAARSRELSGSNEARADVHRARRLCARASGGARGARSLSARRGAAASDCCLRRTIARPACRVASRISTSAEHAGAGETEWSVW